MAERAEADWGFRSFPISCAPPSHVKQTDYSESRWKSPKTDWDLNVPWTLNPIQHFVVPPPFARFVVEPKLRIAGQVLDLNRLVRCDIHNSLSTNASHRARLQLPCQAPGSITQPWPPLASLCLRSTALYTLVVGGWAQVVRVWLAAAVYVCWCKRRFTLLSGILCLLGARFGGIWCHSSPVWSCVF